MQAPEFATTMDIGYGLAGGSQPVRSCLLVENDPRTRSFISSVLAPNRVEEAFDAEEALQLFAQNRFDCVLVSIQLPRAEILALLRSIRDHNPQVPVIVVCSARDVSTGAETIHSGAADFVIKDVQLRSLPERIERAIRRSAQKPREPGHPLSLLVGSGGRMQEVMRIARRVAASRMPVLLLGETGTGKEMFARWIHSMSGRANAAFVGVNLAAIPSDLIESTLFGHEKGAFTGAQSRRVGKFGLAQDGTLLLDEVAELRFDLQAKLLRVLQENEYERVGGTQTLRNEARIIAATNRDVVDAVRQGKFRDDLFYRLNTITISLPPLRERREDIPSLVRLFLEKYNRQCGTEVEEIPAQVMEALQHYHWPGNIRELENAVQRAVILTDGRKATLSDFFDLEGSYGEEVIEPTAESTGTLADVERQYIEQTLRRTGGHQGQAVKILGIDRKTLYNKIIKYGLGRSLDRRAAQA